MLSISNHFWSSSTGITSLNLTGLVTSTATNLYGMLSSLPNITTIDVSSWDTSGAINITYLFSGSTSLTNLNIGDFEMDSVTTQVGVFNSSNITAANSDQYLSCSNDDNEGGANDVEFGGTSYECK